MLANAPQDVLAQLKDIHVPAHVDYFPLAWGWWVLSIFTLILIILSITWIWRKWQFNRARRAALKELKSIRVNTSPSEVLSQCNSIMKRLFLHYVQPQLVASCSGTQWAEVLLCSLPNQAQRQKNRPLIELMQNSLYRNTSLSTNELEQIREVCCTIGKRAQFNSNTNFNVFLNENSSLTPTHNQVGGKHV